jgi:hypothetical protein
MINGDGIIPAIITMFIAGYLILWGLFGLYDYLFLFDGIKSKSRITPTIELVIVDNKVDTLFVYEIK